MPYKRIRRKHIYNITSIQTLCKRPYYNHPHGCPNYNKKKGCPPRTKPISYIIDLEKPMYLIWNCFNFGRHRRRMRRKHPDWSPHQVRCCLWWQPKARKVLEEEIYAFLREHADYMVFRTPEAHGLNVTSLMYSVGISLQWPPKTKVYQVALAGVPK